MRVLTLCKNQAKSLPRILNLLIVSVDECFDASHRHCMNFGEKNLVLWFMLK